MLDPGGGELLLAFLRWIGQAVALRLGAGNVHCSCPACPACPAHSINCSCHGAPPPSSVELSGSFVLFFVGVAVGVGGTLVVVFGDRLCRYCSPKAQPRGPDPEEVDELERIQLEFRRLRT